MMRIKVTLLLMLLTAVLSRAAVYVSSSCGNDGNTGQTGDMPLKTISAALSRSDTVYLKAGDVFCENIVMRGKFLTRYSAGNNPTLSGLIDPGSLKWHNVSGSLWRMDLQKKIAGMYDPETDEIIGRRARHKNELASELDFFQSAADGDDAVYIYSDEDPNFMHTCFTCSEVAVRMSHSTIKSVNILGYGFGISITESGNVYDCKIDVIGCKPSGKNDGCIFYGNGIEYWVGSKDVTDSEVSGCYVSRCYDCGISIQGFGYEGQTARNVDVHDNLIERCCQGWEDFLKAKDTEYENCRVRKNIFIDCGNSGWSYDDGRFKFCNVLSGNSSGERKLLIEENLFIGGNLFCCATCNGKYCTDIWVGNSYAYTEGSFILGNYYGTKDVIRLPERRVLRLSSSMELGMYRKFTSDNSTRIIQGNESELAKMAAREKKRFFGTHIY